MKERWYTMAKKKSLLGTIQEVKASFFDTIYRKQGLVDIFTDKIDTLSPEDQAKIKEYAKKQAHLAGELVDSLEKINRLAAELALTGEGIKQILGEDSITPDLENAPMKKADVVASNNTGSVVDEATIQSDTKSPTEIAGKVEAAPVVQNVVPETNSLEPLKEESSLEKTDVAPGPVAEATASTDNSAVESKTIDNALSTNSSTVVSEETPSTEKVETSNAVVPEITAAPAVEQAKEVVSTQGESTALPNDVPSAAQVVDTAVSESASAPFALSPIDEGVTPVASTEAVVNSTGEETKAVSENTALVVDSSNGDVLRFNKGDALAPKAILVTGVQFGKLSGSRETQKALMSAKGFFGNSAVSNSAQTVVADEQTLMTSGLLAPTEDNKQKQIEGMMEQASTLYKEGKTQEAQALYNQVSTMNQAMQTPAVAEQGKVLVNTPVPPTTVAA